MSDLHLRKNAITLATYQVGTEETVDESNHLSKRVPSPKNWSCDITHLEIGGCMLSYESTTQFYFNNIAAYIEVPVLQLNQRQSIGRWQTISQDKKVLCDKVRPPRKVIDERIIGQKKTGARCIQVLGLQKHSVSPEYRWKLNKKKIGEGRNKK